MPLDDEEDFGSPRVVGITSHDEVMGRMIERTGQLMRQSAKMEQTIEKLTDAVMQSNQVHAQTRLTLEKIDTTVNHLMGSLAETKELEARVRALEDYKISTAGDLKEVNDFKRMVVRWGVIVALATITGSTTIGPFVMKAAEHWFSP